MTYPKNTPSVDDMLNMPTGDLAQMPVELLASLQAELAHATKQLKSATARFSTALEVRYATRASEARRACGIRGGPVSKGKLRVSEILIFCILRDFAPHHCGNFC